MIEKRKRSKTVVYEMREILQHIEQEGYLEDRMEYGVDELMTTYQIGRVEAELLDAMITIRSWGIVRMT